MLFYYVGLQIDAVLFFLLILYVYISLLTPYLTANFRSVLQSSDERFQQKIALLPWLLWRNSLRSKNTPDLCYVFLYDEY